MRILIFGDVVGRSGRNLVYEKLPDLRQNHDVDFVIINGENSAGGGPTDYLHVWSNLQTFLNNSIVDGVNLTATYDPEIYMSARTPLVYIFHKLFNPFVENEIFLREVFSLYHYWRQFYFIYA